MNDDQKINALKRNFEKRDDVVMAFLFGSRAKKQTRAAASLFLPKALGAFQ